LRHVRRHIPRNRYLRCCLCNHGRDAARSYHYRRFVTSGFQRPPPVAGNGATGEIRRGPACHHRAGVNRAPRVVGIRAAKSIWRCACSSSPLGPPFIPAIAKLAHGDIPYAASSALMLTVLTWILLPFTLPAALNFLGTGAGVSSLTVAEPLIAFYRNPAGRGLLDPGTLPQSGERRSSRISRRSQSPRCCCRSHCTSRPRGACSPHCFLPECLVLLSPFH